MSKKAVWIVVIILILAVVWKYSSDKNTAPVDLKLGSILFLSGDLGFIGEEIKKGVDIAIDELKEEGMQVSYISEDNGYDFGKTASAATKLTTIDNVEAILVGTVSEAKPIAQIVNTQKTPLLVLVDSNETLKHAGPYVFSSGFSNEHSGRITAEHAFTKEQVKTVAIIGHQDEAAEIFANAFEAKFIELGGSVVLDERVSPEKRDYKDVILKAQQQKAESIYMALLPPANSIVLKQARELGFKGKFFTTDGFVEEEIAAAGPAAEGVVFPGLFVEDASGLIDAYKKKYTQDPPSTLYTSLGYFGTKIIAEAKRVAVAENISLDEALKQVDTSILGSSIQFNGRQFLERQEKLFKVEGGKPVEIK